MIQRRNDIKLGNVDSNFPHVDVVSLEVHSSCHQVCASCYQRVFIELLSPLTKLHAVFDLGQLREWLDVIN